MFHSQMLKTQLLPGYRVLVHGGAGALGQALTSIALALQCEVFLTVSDMQKKRFLRKLFPQLQGIFFNLKIADCCLRIKQLQVISKLCSEILTNIFTISR